MSDSFRNLIAQTTHNLVEQITASRSERNNTSSEQRKIAIEISGAENFGHVIVFPAPETALSVSWLIFRGTSPADRSQEMTLQLEERLSDSITNDEYVIRAHRALLKRPVDLKNQSLFVRLMETGQFLRSDLLSVLARSAEAKALDLLIVLMPEPSVWTNGLGMKSSSLSTITVRMPK